MSRREVLSLMLVINAVLVALALGLGLLLDEHSIQTLHWSWPAAGRGVLATLPMLAFLTLVMCAPTGTLARLRARAIELLGPLFECCRLLDLCLIAALAGFCEELLFRGVLQPLAQRCLTFVSADRESARVWAGAAGIAIVSLIFAALHALSRSYFCVALGMSLYLGLVYWLGGDLLVPMVAHGLYDLAALLWLVLDWRRRPRPTWWRANIEAAESPIAR